jgi:hypothetical protein
VGLRRLCPKNHHQPLRGHQKLCYLTAPNRQRTDAATASPTAAAPTAAPTVRPGLIDPDAELEGFGTAERAAEARACLRRTVAFDVRARLVPAVPAAGAGAAAAAAAAGAEDSGAGAEAARAAGAVVVQGLAAAGKVKIAGAAGARAGSADEENDKGQMHKQEHKPAAHHSRGERKAGQRFGAPHVIS